MAILIRVGLPSPGGALVEHARSLGAPVMVSANSFVRRRGEFGDEWTPRRSPPTLDGLDAALDSGGFSSMVTYNDVFTPEYYVGAIVQDYPWSFWAQLDLTCEPEVAGNPLEVILRIAESVRLFHACAELARRAGIPPPMPVLQGWTPADYVRSAVLAGLHLDAPPLVGLGSVCRRHTHGPSGILAVVEALDQVLPPTTRLHGFGLKSSALGALLSRPALATRIASVDSMAWDAAARRAHPTGRTPGVRAGFMRRWYLQQRSVVDHAPQGQPTLPCRRDPASLDWRTGCPVLDQYIELVAGGELEMRPASGYLEREVVDELVLEMLRAEPGRPQLRRRARSCLQAA